MPDTPELQTRLRLRKADMMQATPDVRIRWWAVWVVVRHKVVVDGRNQPRWSFDGVVSQHIFKNRAQDVIENDCVFGFWEWLLKW